METRLPSENLKLGPCLNERGGNPVECHFIVNLLRGEVRLTGTDEI